MWIGNWPEIVSVCVFNTVSCMGVSCYHSRLEGMTRLTFIITLLRSLYSSRSWTFDLTIERIVKAVLLFVVILYSTGVYFIHTIESHCMYMYHGIMVHVLVPAHGVVHASPYM